MAATMSASRLQSNVIDKALSDDNGNGPVEGVYGTHGFYFQVYAMNNILGCATLCLLA